MTTVEALNNTVWARIAPSPLGGVGVFAIRDIPASTVFSDYRLGMIAPQIRISKNELSELHPAIRSLVLDQFLSHNEQCVIASSPNFTVNLRCFMNHSHTPNTNGIKTLVEIKEGEELTEDYTSFHPLSSISINHFGDILKEAV